MPKAAKASTDQFPMMQPGLMDYIDGEYKIIDFESESDFVSVHHSLKGNSLVSQYVQEGDAVFAIEVSSPESTYRKIFKHEWKDVQPSTDVKQSVPIDREKIDGIVYCRPLIVVRDSIEEKTVCLQAEHGVHEWFYGRKMLIRPGTILARDESWNLNDYQMSLFEVDENKSLKQGTFEVKAIPRDGFYFRVEFASDLYRLMSNRSDDQYDLRNAILTFAFSEGLNIVYREYREEESWQGHLALRRLHERIKKEGLAAWDEEYFKPEKIVTTLKPIKGGLRDDERD